MRVNPLWAISALFSSNCDRTFFVISSCDRTQLPQFLIAFAYLQPAIALPRSAIAFISRSHDESSDRAWSDGQMEWCIPRMTVEGVRGVVRRNAPYKSGDRTNFNARGNGLKVGLMGCLIVL